MPHLVAEEKRTEAPGKASVGSGVAASGALTGLGLVLRLASTFAIARGLSAPERGYFGTIQTLGFFVSVSVCAGLPVAASILVPRTPGLARRFALVAGAQAVLAFGAVALGQDLLSYFPSVRVHPQSWLVLALLAASWTAHAMLYAAAISSGRYVAASIGSFLNFGGAALVQTVAVAAFGLGADGVLLVTGGAAWVSDIWLLVVVLGVPAASASWSALLGLRGLVGRSLLFTVAEQTLLRAPLFAISLSLASADIGLFALGQSITESLLLIPVQVASVLRVGAATASADRVQVGLTTRLAVIVTGAATLGMMAFSPLGFAWVFGPAYERAWAPTVMCCLATGALGSSFPVGSHLQGQFEFPAWQSLLYIGAGVGCTALGFLFFGASPLWAASLSLSSSYLAVAGVLVWRAKRLLHYRARVLLLPQWEDFRVLIGAGRGLLRRRAQ